LGIPRARVMFMISVARGAAGPARNTSLSGADCGGPFRSSSLGQAGVWGSFYMGGERPGPHVYCAKNGVSAPTFATSMNRASARSSFPPALRRPR
jgi:hypothetical protein